ncbi:MAG: lipoyl(octanoyl) transferase LipB [Bacteroidetes bacterium]|nr:lipoyl(octanoyl) transferase LipB [Bacteroidota bacterium]MDA1120209.1 lipoyl(octanoyl) transferase LipB [Bacteroidota bacterium]
MNENINNEVKFIDLGLIDYQQAWSYQEQLFKECIEIKIKNRAFTAENQRKTPNHLIFCEHPHVYTLGKSGDAKNLLLNKKQLGKAGVEFFHINRGGDITYHGPGQIVGYPILDLDNFFTDIHRYLRFLEEAVIRTLNDFGILAGRIDGLTGVWLDYNNSKARKICALGVKTSKWVTMHGFAFNVNVDLSYYNNIIPCGINDKAITSLHNELGFEPDIVEIQQILKNHITDIFKMKISNAK